MQEVVHGYQAKLASQGQSTKTRHPGGRGGGKRGGKVLPPPLTMSPTRLGPFPTPKTHLFHFFNAA